MPKYNSREKVSSGLPLGGIGTGKVEICPNGLLTQANLYNNWEKPAQGSHSPIFAVRVKKGWSVNTFLLEAGSSEKLPQVDLVKMDGKFPVAELQYIRADMCLDVRLKAFSSFIPGQYKDSGIPGVVFEFSLHNPNPETVDVSLLGWMINTAGENYVGRYNVLRQNKELIQILFKTSSTLPTDISDGELSFGLAKESFKVSYITHFSRSSAPDYDLCAFNRFREKGCLPDTSDSPGPATGGGNAPAGALSAATKLKPGGSKKCTYYLVWYMPNSLTGHAYTRWFKDAGAVVSYLHRRKRSLISGIEEWHSVFGKANLPDWLEDALINNLYVLVSSSWWGKDNSFAIWEAAIGRRCPLMSTTDLRYYYSFPLALLFPEFERTEIKEYVKAQRKDGYIPHDLGYCRIDLPSDGTSAPPKWKDLCPNFVLMVYRDYLWFGKDEKFLRETYPSVKKAMKWEFGTDCDGDGLPENEGQDQTFDGTQFYGVHAYSSSIFLAALQASVKMAEVIGDRKFVSTCREWFRRGQKSFLKKLWNGKYFVACCGPGGKKYDACTSSQLSGQWYAHLLDLGYIVPEEYSRSSARSIWELNSKASRYGVVNSVLPDGRIDRYSHNSECIWPGIAYAAASLVIFEGMVDEGLEMAYKTWKNISKHIKNAWNQPDVVSADNGKFGYGDHYPRSMSIWSVFLALARHQPEISKAIQFLKDIAREGNNAEAKMLEE